jgi:hypothetical protein
MGRIFAVGDIHGCLDQLKEMISLLDIDRNQDTLVLSAIISIGGLIRKASWISSSS